MGCGCGGGKRLILDQKKIEITNKYLKMAEEYRKDKYKVNNNTKK